MRPLTQLDAEAIALWHYPEPYSFYDWTEDPADLAELLDPVQRGEAYFGVDDAAGALIGFFSFKFKHADRRTVDIGLGLHPDSTGQGFGGAFLAAGLDFGHSQFAPERFVLSVATFNRRAITVYERAGFVPVRVYEHATNGGVWEFLEMRRPA